MMSIVLKNKNPYKCRLKHIQSDFSINLGKIPMYLIIMNIIYRCDTLRDLVPLIQFKNVKNTHEGVLLLEKLATLLNTPPLVFFTFFKLYKWHQIVQHITIMHITVSYILISVRHSRNPNQVIMIDQPANKSIKQQLPGSLFLVKVNTYYEQFYLQYDRKRLSLFYSC